ncbi:hypothetical protein [Acidimangrovimonas pyrenivorans]|uniref:Restriction endonuclease subunit S n=1 Tax=Acidimangrovimonas pyrenivorans TaxID=2030798 RepID=A0ABV7AFB6_9RHOB
MRFDHIAELNPTVPIQKGEDAPFIDMASLPEHDRGILHFAVRSFNGSGSRFQDGDTLIARITPCLENGKGAMVSGLGAGNSAFGSTEFVVARARIASDEKFVYYASRSEAFREVAISRMEGTSGRQRVSWQQLASIEVPDLPRVTRKSVGEVLGALDDKIELNRKTAATLEEMARALFRSWFVDFDPVEAKAAGRAPAHVDAAIAALFPDTFGPDGLPAGWTYKLIGDHVDVSRGLSYKGSGLCEEGFGLPMHNLNSIFEGGGYKREGIKFYHGEHKARHEIRAGDLIVANTEQAFDLELIGFAALVPSSFGPSGLFSQHLFKVGIKADSPLSKEWLYYALNASWIGVKIRSFSNGTTVNMLPQDAFEIPAIPIPPREVVIAFDRIVKPMIARQEEAREEAETLAVLRDTLLPKLMSGELRVGEAREQVEEVA